MIIFPSLHTQFVFNFLSWINHIILYLPLALFILSVQLSYSVMCDSLWPHGLQHARLPHPSPIPGVYSNSCPFSWWCHPTISSSGASSPPTFNLSQHQGLFQWVSSSHQVAEVLELQCQSSQWIFRVDYSRAIPSFPSQLEWNIGLPWANTRGILNSPS